VTELDAGELLERARRALGRRWPGAEIGALEPLPGGISSLTFSAMLRGAGDDDGRVVLKVAPPGLAPVRNRDVLRQARVIDAVHDVPGVRVPAVLAQDDGSPPFFVMEFVAGESYEPKWDVSDVPPAPAVVGARVRAAARMLARLQAVEPSALGLGAEPAPTPAEEVERWGALFGTAGDDLRGDEEQLRRALSASTPAPGPGRVLHGDYRLGNIQFDGDRPAAIIDWELWSVGDPRADVAWLMAFTDPVQQRVAHRDAVNQAAADAMPDAQAVLSEYLDAAGGAGPPVDLHWFLAFSYYKLGAAMAVLAKRNRRLPEPDPGLELAAQTLAPMLDRGRELLAAS
jgi:aminoglycoside phosphotransferase (APT) family kinase protein